MLTQHACVVAAHTAVCQDIKPGTIHVLLLLNEIAASAAGDNKWTKPNTGRVWLHAPLPPSKRTKHTATDKELAPSCLSAQVASLARDCNRQSSRPRLGP